MARFVVRGRNPLVPPGVLGAVGILLVSELEKSRIFEGWGHFALCLPCQRPLDLALKEADGGLKIMCPAAVVIAILLLVRLVLGLEILPGCDADADSSHAPPLALAKVLCTGIRGCTRCDSFSDAAAIAAAAAAEKAL